jgi:hypothetical protein
MREKKNAHGARSGVNALNHRALKLLIPDRLSSIVFPVLSSLFEAVSTQSKSLTGKKKPANKLVESAHHLRLTETWEFLAQSSETESFRPATGLSDCCVVVRKIESNHHSLRRGTVKVVRRSPATRLFRTPIFFWFLICLCFFLCVSFESQTLRTKYKKRL